MRDLNLLLCLVFLILSGLIAAGCTADELSYSSAPVATSDDRDHPSQVELIQFIDGGLSSQDRAHVHDHLRRCERCDDYLASVEAARSPKQFRD